MQLGRHLVVVGSIATEVYLVAADEIYVRPGGSAYRAACAMLPFEVPVSVVATSAQSFNREWLKKFDRSVVRILDETVAKGRDNVCIFDLRNGNGTQPQSSFGRPLLPPIEVLARNPFRDLHVHLAVLPPAVAATVIEKVREIAPSASLSCSLNAHLLEQDLETLTSVLRKCSVITLSLEAYRKLAALTDLQPLLASRLVIVTYGAAGSLCLANGVPVFAHTPRPYEVVSDIGADDVFAGAFLVNLVAKRDLSHAVAAASELAAASVTDFGVEEILRLRHALPQAKPKELFGVPKLPIADPLSFDPGSPPQEYDATIEATGVFVVRDGKLLLARKPDSKAFKPGLLYVPGGKLEPGESPEQCARRELKEETGLEGGSFKPLGIFYYPHPQKPRQLYRFFQYLATETTGEPDPKDDVVDCIWHTLSSLDHGRLFDLTSAQLFLLDLLQPVG